MMTVRRRRRMIGATIALAALLICTSAEANSASPRNSPTHRADTLSGRCEFTGTVTFRPPLSNAPQNITQHVDAPGTCSGTFVGPDGASRRLDDARSTYLATERSSGASCAGGTASGSG